VEEGSPEKGGAFIFIAGMIKKGKSEIGKVELYR
jgi:hypothetical protein